jgi:hypothetical protein
MLESAMDAAGLHLHLFTELCKLYIHISTYVSSDRAIADCNGSDDDHNK